MVVVALGVVAAGAASLGTEFTYQGILSDAGSPATGDFDFRCYLYNAESGGSQVGPMVLVEDLLVTEGRITTQLDFGAVFDGTALWLEVGVRDGGSGGGYTVLSPRQELTAAPFAQHAQSADTAVTATTAGHATTAGDADTVDGQHGSYYLTWSNFVGIPADIADGDDDTIGDLSCSSDEIARWNGSAWNCSSDDDTPYKRTFVVSPVGTPTQNGTALRNAIAAITPPTSQEEAVLLKLEPGLYDVGDTGIATLDWMTIEGAGRGLTRITGEVCDIAEGVLAIGSDYSGIRRITIENTCTDVAGDQVSVSVAGADIMIENARIEITGAAHNNYALSTSGETGALRVADVELKAENGSFRTRAVNNYRPEAYYEGITAEASGGTQTAAFYNRRDSVTVTSSVLKGFGAGSKGYHAESVQDIALDDVVAEGETYGVSLNSATGTLTDVRAAGQFGIYLTGADDVILYDVIASGTQDGIYVNSSDPAVMHNVVADGGVTGVVCGSFSSLSIMHSRIGGVANALVVTAGSTATLDGTILQGGSISGVATCTACMRNGTFSASGCP